MTEQEYIPFGDEWEKEVMTHSKEQLVNWWKKSLQKIIELESDRDKFAMEFAMWLQINQWDYYPSGMVWIKGQDYLNGKETFELIDLYKQSLTKTEQR